MSKASALVCGLAVVAAFAIPTAALAAAGIWWAVGVEVVCFTLVGVQLAFAFARDEGGS